MTEEVREIDMMSRVDQNPKAHEDSTAKEEMLLRDEHGLPDTAGIYSARLEAEGSADEADATPEQEG